MGSPPLIQLQLPGDLGVLSLQPEVGSGGRADRYNSSKVIWPANRAATSVGRAWLE